MPSPIPSSTYRLHLTHEFTLDDAAALVDHVDRLGVDWLYASPIQTVPPGATHGYHITDPAEVNPELGGRAALDALSAALQARDRGLILDIVPNHLGATTDNARWADLLRHGPESAHARTFDVDLGTPEDPRPVVLPVLGAPVEEVLAAGDIAIERGGDPALVLYGETRLPLAPGTDLAAPLEDVLAQQHYRLMHWQAGERALNWRRFFAVNELAAVRVEDEAVFDDIHPLVNDLVQTGVVQGLRVDHIDGLNDPEGYLHRLRELVGPDVLVLVEKILETGEPLPSSWPVAGTTGYEVAAMIGAWLTDHDGHEGLRHAFAQRTGISSDAAQDLPMSKHHVLVEMFSAEVDAVIRLLGPVEGVPAEDVARVVRDLAANLRGYRTYVPADGAPAPEDRARIDDAAAAASVTTPTRVVHAVVDSLLTQPHRPALRRWQQLTGPAAAKGFEDRLLFQHVALASLCEVGADDHLLDDPPTPDVAAQAIVARQDAWPHAGTTSSTHDTKLAEDVRARIAVLAEVREAFTDLLDELDAALPDASVDGHARWLLTQVALGALDLESPDPADLTERLQQYAGKVLREAELRTSHRDPDEVYEAEVAAWITALTAPGDAATALRSLADLIAVPGASNALSALVLKLTAPGVPDVYRGTETWDGSLVDPDNRRRLQTDRLRGLMADLDDRVGADGTLTEDRVDDVAALRDGWSDGLIKLHVTRAGLHLRRQHRELFADGTIHVPTATGSCAEHVAALRRRLEGRTAITVATRLPWQMAEGAWPVGDVWADTEVEVGTSEPLRDVLTGRIHQADHGRVQIGHVLDVLPVAMLVSHV